VFLVRRALGLHGVEAELTVIADGQVALGFIEKADAGEVSWRPELMLLDLNLPRATGARILERLRQQSSRFSGVPVIIVTSSDSPADRDQALRLGATQYFHKPIDLAGFMALGGIVRTLLQDSRVAVSG
jgi:chemotaxis family two-component system response regulator Rcp1